MSIELVLKAAAADDAATLRALLAGSPDLVNATGPHPYWSGHPAPIHVAAEWGAETALAVLAEYGADFNDPGTAYGGWCPMWLVALRRPHLGRLLIGYGARLDACSAAALGYVEELGAMLPGAVRELGPDDVTPLHWASTPEIASLLLQNGADPNAKTKSGNLPERTAARWPEVARYLLSRADRGPDIHLAAAIGDVDRIRMLLASRPALIRSFSFRGDAAGAIEQGPPLHAAAYYGQIEAARVLLEHGAKITGVNRAGVPPLHCTAMRGELAMAKFLVENGADVNQIEPVHQSTPLGWARFQRQPRLAELLISLGARE